MSITDELDALQRAMGLDLVHSMDRHGLSLAKVTNVTDPDKFNRVKCLPVGSENAEETDWCYVMAPAGGKSAGFFWFPQVDDLVVLDYLDGDPHRPLVLGSIWTTEVSPPVIIQDGKVQDYVMCTPSKIELSMHDEEKKHKATLVMPSGTTLILDDENQKVQLKDKEGKNALEMDLAGGTIVVKAAEKLELNAGNGSAVITMESGNITIKANSKIAAEAANIEEKATTGLKLEGATAEVKANTKLDLTASGPTSVKGAMVSIN